jgi:hypothetical protein
MGPSNTPWGFTYTLRGFIGRRSGRLDWPLHLRFPIIVDFSRLFFGIVAWLIFAFYRGYGYSPRGRAPGDSMSDVITVRTAPRGRPGRLPRPTAPPPGQPDTVLDGRTGRPA